MVMNQISVMTFREMRPDFVSRMIMRFGKAPYSHIAICFEQHGEKWLSHATGKGVHRAKLSPYLDEHILVGEKKFNLTCSGDEFLGYIKGAEGKDYAEAQYIGFIFPYKWVQKLIADGNKDLICSEWVGNILVDCCGKKFDNLDFKSPRDIWEAI